MGAMCCSKKPNKDFSLAVILIRGSIHHIWQRGYWNLPSMATKFGTIDAFNSESDSIKAYLEQVQLYSSANDVPENKYVPILLSFIGIPTYALLSDLLAPQLRYLAYKLYQLSLKF